MNSGLKVEAVIIDADFAIKIGRIDKFRLIEQVLPLLADLIFIHRHVYENEILILTR